MKTILTFLLILQTAVLSTERHVSFDSPGQESSKWTWLPITLTDAERDLLSKRSDPPRTALDYYLFISDGYFGNIDSGVERRITFIEFGTLSDQYLHAEYTIPSTDAGAFSITIRLFGVDDETLIAISHRKGDKNLFAASGDGSKGLWSIHMNQPEFWHYRDDALLRVSNIVMPDLSVMEILDRYRNHYKAHLNHPTQQKRIRLTYELPQKGNLVQVTGRENFMDPGEKYVWADFVYDGKTFTQTSKANKTEMATPRRPSD